jgi:integrase
VGASRLSPLVLSDSASADALQLIGLHEARHIDASLMITAGVNIKTISAWMGHSSVNSTLDRYVHLLPGSAQVALGRRNEFLDKELA